MRQSLFCLFDKSAKNNAGLACQGQCGAVEGSGTHTYKGGQLCAGDLRILGKVDGYFRSGGVVNHSHGFPLVLGQETANLAFVEGKRSVGAIGNLGICLANGNELLLVIIQAIGVGQMFFYRAICLLGGVVGTDGIFNGVLIAPQHSKAAVGIRVIASPGA